MLGASRLVESGAGSWLIRLSDPEVCSGELFRLCSVSSCCRFAAGSLVFAGVQVVKGVRAVGEPSGDCSFLKMLRRLSCSAMRYVVLEKGEYEEDRKVAVSGLRRLVLGCVGMV